MSGPATDSTWGSSKWDPRRELGTVTVQVLGHSLEQHLDISLQAEKIGVLGLVSHGGKVAEPKTQIEQRLDRLELAVGTMAQWLVQAQTGFGARDAEGIEKILRGEGVDEAKDPE